MIKYLHAGDMLRLDNLEPNTRVIIVSPRISEQSTDVAITPGGNWELSQVRTAPQYSKFQLLVKHLLGI